MTTQEAKKVPKRTLAHPDEGKSDADQKKAIIHGFEQYMNGHYDYENIHGTMNDPDRNGRRRITITADVFDVDPAAQAEPHGLF